MSLFATLVSATWNCSETPCRGVGSIVTGGVETDSRLAARASDEEPRGPTEEVSAALAGRPHPDSADLIRADRDPMKANCLVRIQDAAGQSDDLCTSTAACLMSIDTSVAIKWYIPEVLHSVRGQKLYV